MTVAASPPELDRAPVRATLVDALDHLTRVCADLRSRIDELEGVLRTLGSAPAPAVADDLPIPPAFLATTATLPPLEVACFGRFEVRRGGRLLELCNNRSGQTIFRFLVVQPHHRATSDVLMEALWPDDDPETARHKLHVAVSALRGALNAGLPTQKGSGYLLHADGSYQINPAAELRIDAERLMARFRRGPQTGGAAAIADYEAACRLYRGAFLPDDVYADWAALRAEQIAQAYRAMCGALSGHYLAAGRCDEAVVWAMACLEGNPCDEAAHRQLMRAYAADGHRGEAIRQYQRCERLLAAELGVEPMPETTALYLAIQRGDPLPA